MGTTKRNANRAAAEPRHSGPSSNPQRPHHEAPFRSMKRTRGNDSNNEEMLPTSRGRSPPSLPPLGNDSDIQRRHILINGKVVGGRDVHSAAHNGDEEDDRMDDVDDDRDDDEVEVEPHEESHGGLEDIQLDLNNLGEDDGSFVPAVGSHEFGLEPHQHEVLVGATSTNHSIGSSHHRQKAQWTPERIAELRELVARNGQVNLSRQNSNFWSEVTSSSKTLVVFTKEAVRMKARRLGLLSDHDGCALSQQQQRNGGIGNQCAAASAAAAAAGGNSPELPREAKLDLLDALLARGVTQKQLRAVTAKRGGDPAALSAWLTSLLGQLKEEVASGSGQAGATGGGGTPKQQSRRRTSDAGGGGSGGGVKWTSEREEELRELVTRAEAAQAHVQATPDSKRGGGGALSSTPASASPGVPVTQRPNFWRDLVGNSRTLRGFSTDALRGKAKRMGILSSEPLGGGALASASSAGAAGNGSVDADAHKGRWNPGQMAELRSLVLARSQRLGSAVVHERGFWLEIRNRSESLKSFSNESLRMKARRMQLLDSATATLAPPGALGAPSSGGPAPPAPERRAQEDEQSPPPASTSTLPRTPAGASEEMISPSGAGVGSGSKAAAAASQQHKRGWSEANMAELRDLLLSQWEAGVSQSSNGFWEGIIRSSSSLHTFKPDSVRKKAKAMGEKGQLPEELLRSSGRRQGEDGKPTRQMPLNPAQVKELQQLLCARWQGSESSSLVAAAALINASNGQDDEGFWTSLQNESRTLKSFSIGVLKAKAEKLQQQGALTTATPLDGHHHPEDDHGHHHPEDGVLSALSNSNGLHPHGDEDMDAMAVAWGHLNDAAVDDIPSPVALVAE